MRWRRAWTLSGSIRISWRRRPGLSPMPSSRGWFSCRHFSPALCKKGSRAPLVRRSGGIGAVSGQALKSPHHFGRHLHPVQNLSDIQWGKPEERRRARLPFSIHFRPFLMVLVQEIRIPPKPSPGYSFCLDPAPKFRRKAVTCLISPSGQLISPRFACK